MRVRMLGGAAITAVIATALLMGCVPEPPDPTPSPTDTAVFASEVEALAAAEEAYAAYLRVSDEIFADGGEEPERLLTVATESLLELEAEGFSRRRATGLRSVGSTTFRNSQIDSFDSVGRVSIRACVDISGVDVIDQSGVSVVPADRVNQTTFLLSFEGTPMRLATESVWNGDSLC